MTPSAARLTTLTAVALPGACAAEPLPAQQPDYDTLNGPVTHWDDIESLCDRWATAVRRGLETLVSE